MSIHTVTSADGTSIAFETTGKGPPLILVGGAFCDRTAASSGTPLAALLAHRFTVFSYDRRGRGDSGDTPPHAPEREGEDLAALIAAAGGSAAVFGISSGGLLALDAAVRGLPIPKLVAYEPPVILDVERAQAFEVLATQLDEAARGHRRAEAVELFLTRVVQMPAPAVAQLRKAPMWAGLEQLAHTLSYDLLITARGPSRLEQVPAVRAATLVMDGGASPGWMREANQTLARAIPGARHRTLEGQTHAVDPKALARALEEFLSE
ncbi:MULTISPECIES: alpha/beta fold hydrolase [unclassified Corallococcus]|uniref:alpha/beta fold hydrolase n=1 Tax=unclassified Corallococcus TaxID=2685029 RepID=UPI001A8C1A27|nr:MULTISPECIES: alpha/beta hydrolase [unclassified Corallococcus]MBN9685888.1 alpha/beta hydrolase [Corallococcus sp. NCSPR001]WAS82671.1 alpha/beta hydrolase [Corallococcus sp. NCRR]